MGRAKSYLAGAGLMEPPRGKARWNSQVAERLAEHGFFVVHRHALTATTYHLQPGLEWNFTHEGRSVMWLDGRAVSMAPRRACLFDARAPHRMAVDAALPYRRTVVCLDPIGIAVSDRYGVT